MSCGCGVLCQRIFAVGKVAKYSAPGEPKDVPDIRAARDFRVNEGGRLGELGPEGFGGRAFAPNISKAAVSSLSPVHTRSLRGSGIQARTPRARLLPDTTPRFVICQASHATTPPEPLFLGLPFA
jgi:hypothetical protein